MKLDLRLLVAAVLARNTVGEMVAQVGDTVCVEGYIMDYYCIDTGVLFDNTNVATLSAAGPVVHSVECLVDPPQCPDSGFEILPALAPGADTYCRNFRIPKRASSAMVALIEHISTAGACKYCNNPEGSWERGFRATVTGVVTDAGNSTWPATIGEDLQIMESEVGCDDDEYRLLYSMAAIDCLGLTQDVISDDGTSMGSITHGLTLEMLSAVTMAATLAAAAMF